LGRSSFGNRSYVLAFAQKPEPANYRLGHFNRLTHVWTRYLIQGFVWLQPDGYQVTRMETYALIGAGSVRSQTTDVRYWKVQFEGVPNSFWPPCEVTADVNVNGKIYRNRHEYSDYKLFDIQTDYNIALPVISSPESSGPARY
jgi:hypothetical protein